MCRFQDCPQNCHCYRWPSNQTKISVVGNDLLSLFSIPSLFPRYTSAMYVPYSDFFCYASANFVKLQIYSKMKTQGQIENKSFERMERNFTSVNSV